MTGLPERLTALRTAVELSRGRIDEDIVEQASQVVARATRRLEFSGDWTVVAVAGATGSGKSSLFNAITGTSLATTGVLRPTTDHTLAAAWGSEMPDDLLDWLNVSQRHLIPAPKNDYTSLVLLDLPDHDSIRESNRLQVDHLVSVVDMLVWVLDPQKYADAALHESYLVPLAGHKDVMVVALNQIDTLTAEQTEQCLTDLRTLLDSEGLGSVDIVPVSATSGHGVADLGRLIIAAVRKKQVAAARLSADITNAATRLAPLLGNATLTPLSRAAGRELTDALVASAGGDIVIDAVGDAWRTRGAFATGWPMLSWIHKLKADPLTRLGIGRKRAPLEAPRRTSLPGASPVQSAAVDLAVRSLADHASEGMPRPWALAVQDAARKDQPLLRDRLDTAIAGVDIAIKQGQLWWGIVRVIQWLLIVSMVAGLAWLTADFLLAYAQLPALPRFTWWGWPVPTLLSVGGALAGIIVAGLCRVGVELGARRKRVRARSQIRKAVAAVAAEQIVAPVTAERERYQRAVDAVRTAQ